MLKLVRPLAFIDIESTGKDPVKDRIVQIGVSVIQVDPKAGRKRWSSMVNPGIPIPEEATKIHHITDADVANAPNFADIAEKLYVGLIGKDLGGFNIRRFDIIILDEEFRRVGVKLTLEHVNIIDCFTIYQKKSPRTLDDAVREYCGRERVESHGAQVDADDTADVFEGQVLMHQDLSVMTLEELASYSNADDRQYADLGRKLYIGMDGYMRFNFGKHRDERVVDRLDFARWMLDKNFPGSTLDAIEREMRKPECI